MSTCSLYADMAKKKDVLINLKLSADTREDFRVVAELRGSSMSGLIHQFIVQSIREEKMKEPEAFAKKKKGGK